MSQKVINGRLCNIDKEGVAHPIPLGMDEARNWKNHPESMPKVNGEDSEKSNEKGSSNREVPDFGLNFDDDELDTGLDFSM